MEKLRELVSLCKCSVMVNINDHRDSYGTVKEHFTNYLKLPIDPQILAEMNKRDTMVEVVAYTETAGGFYRVFHYDIDTAIEQMLEIVKNK